MTIHLQTGDICMICNSDKARVPAALVGVQVMLTKQFINAETYLDSFWEVALPHDPKTSLEFDGRTVQLHDDVLMLVHASPRQ
jgi:hypothetical protein